MTPSSRLTYVHVHVRYMRTMCSHFALLWYTLVKE